MRGLALTFSLAAPLHANADDFNGGGTNAEPQTENQIYRSALKSQVAATYLAHRKAGGTPANFPAEQIALLERELNDGEPLDLSINAQYPSNYPSGSLGSPAYQEQINECFCGPASAWMALKHRGAGNNHFGAALNQDNLSTWYWLETDQACPGEGTPRGTNWEHTLNSWVDATDDGWYLLTPYDYADAADVAGKVVVNIDYGYAPVFNIWMNTSRGYLPGWSSAYGEVKHYVPGRGYTSYGDYFNYIEVFAPVTSGYKNGITKERFAGILSNMGIIW